MYCVFLWLRIRNITKYTLYIRNRKWQLLVKAPKNNVTYQQNNKILYKIYLYTLVWYTFSNLGSTKLSLIMAWLRCQIFDPIYSLFSTWCLNNIPTKHFLFVISRDKIILIIPIYMYIYTRDPSLERANVIHERVYTVATFTLDALNIGHVFIYLG